MKLLYGKEYSAYLLVAIENAKHSIDIIMFDWRFYPSYAGHPVQRMNNAIYRAVKRGVRVRVISNSETVCASLRKYGVSAKRLLTYKVTHAKFVLIDQKTCFVGSHNFTQSGFESNLELSLMVDLTEKDTDFIRTFDTLWGV